MSDRVSQGNKRNQTVDKERLVETRKKGGWAKWGDTVIRALGKAGQEETGEMGRESHLNKI